MKKIIRIIIILAVIVGLIYWIMSSSKGIPNQNPLGLASFGTNSTNSSDSSASDSKFPQRYSNITYHISFGYPVGLKPSEFQAPDGVGYVILVSDSKTGQGMQVYITPFTDPILSLTAESIKKSLPKLTMINPQAIQVGSSGTGVIFNDGVGPDAKVQEWFASGGYLYQVTAPVSFADTLKDIISTWKFQ